MSEAINQWALVCHLDCGDGGLVAVIEPDTNGFKVGILAEAESTGKQGMRRPFFLGVSDQRGAIVFDPESKMVKHHNALSVDAFPAYAYRDKVSDLVWFMNDGDKKTGNDDLNCGQKGSTVHVTRNNGANGELIKTICVGRGHHVTTFTTPSAAFPDIPKRAFVSNLIDGSISVLANDPDDASHYLQVINTINLCESAKEDSGEMILPNNAFPHGKEFSPAMGKIYSLNNGYGTVAVIDPVSMEIEDRIELKVSSNLLLSPNGKFLIGKGADRKSNADHVLGRLTVIDAEQRKVVTTVDLQDVYPSVYRFSPDGSRLYVTTAATGKGQQRDNLKVRSVLIYDASQLPALPLLKEVELGLADCGRRPIAFYAPEGRPTYVFIPNPTDGTMSILDGQTDEVVDTVSMFDGEVSDVNFSFWRGDTYGA